MAETDSQKAEYKSLQEAFSVFNEASSRLESKYNALLEEAKQLRENLRKKEEEMKRQERLAMLGETAAAIAHEVRNPLGAIRLFVSLLKRELNDQSRSLELVDQIEASISALDNVVANILQFSRDSSISFAPVNIHSIIQEQLLRFPRSATNMAVFDVALSGNPFINGNESALRQVFYNLILNAMQATQYQGRVSLSVFDDSFGNLTVIIRDNGPGVPESILDNVFEPFVTSKNEGTGLGLAIVRKIVEQHHGSIEVKNDHGAVFKLYFPRGESI